MRIHVEMLSQEEYEIVCEALDNYSGDLLSDLHNKYAEEKEVLRKRDLIARLQKIFRDMADDERFGIKNAVAVAQAQEPEADD